MRARPRGERLDAGGLRHVQRVDMGGGGAGLAGVDGGLFEAIHAAGAEQQLRARRAERPRRRRAEPAGRAGDENPFVCKSCWHNGR